MIAIGSVQGGVPVSVGAADAAGVGAAASGDAVGETATIPGCDPPVLQPAITAMTPAQAIFVIALAISGAQPTTTY